MPSGQGRAANRACVYNRINYAAEKRTSLQRWGDHVMALVAGEASKVVPPRSAGVAT